MAIDFSLKLKGEKVTEELLVNEINNLGVNIGIEKIVEGNIFQIDSIYDSLGFNVTLIRNEEPPYNVYETSFLEEDFEFSQSILFGFDKKADLNISYGKALELIFKLIKILNTSALLTSSVYDEICYFENATNVYIKSEVSLSEKINNITIACGEWNCFYK